jgi:outer membrane protein assembly factor BamB
MSIRHLATSFSGSVVAAGEFERTVHVWDLAATRHLATFDTVLSFGGKRLAITGDGECCIAAAYHVEGVAAYSASTGAEVWHRKDLKKAQTIRFGHDDRRVYCCFDKNSCHVLSRETGKTIKTWPGVRDVWESPYEPLMLVEKGTLVLRTPDEKKVTTIARETFAVLRIAFAPGVVCISESTGPLRCLDTKTGEEAWRYAQKGQHFLQLAYAEEARCFVGVCWPYERGGQHRLLRFGPESGQVSEVSELGQSGDFAFCQRGSCLLSSDGLVIDSVTARRLLGLRFPVRDRRGT